MRSSGTVVGHRVRGDQTGEDTGPEAERVDRQPEQEQAL